MAGLVTFFCFATIAVNSLMILFLSTVGGEFRRSIRAFIMSAVLANFWALGALLLLIFPLSSLGNAGRLLFVLAPMWVMYWLFLFAEHYPGGLVVSSRVRHAALVIAIVASAAAGYGIELIIPATQSHGDGLYIATVGQIPYMAYAGYFGIFSLLYSYSFQQKIRRSLPSRQHQIWFAYGGMLISSFVAFLTNLILPLFGISEYIWMGPASSFIYALSYAFAMKRYRLFDLRRFATRAVVYFVALIVMVTIYAFVMGVIRNILEQVLRTPVSSDIFYTIMTVFAIFLYEPLKRLFDRYTKQIFFKNDYEIQDVIDELGGLLLRANTRRDIQSHTSKVLRKTLLTDQVRVVMSDEVVEIDAFMQLFRRPRTSVIIVDNTNVETARWMREHDHELISLVKAQDHILGWIVFGPKRSGDAYTQQDISLADIVSDEVAIALENALQYEQIQEFNQTLQLKIKEATDELQHSNRRLRELDASKDEFMSMASHQLRTPLTSIKGYISMLLEGDLGRVTPQQRKALEEAYNSSQRMVYLIGDFLNVSRLQTGKFELELTNASLSRIIEEEIAQLRASAESRGVVLQYEPPTDFPMIAVDETKIRQVMMNFIDNAIYYSKPTGGKVHVSLVHDASDVVFRVRDNGIGVPAAARSHLFMKFYRASNARKARPDGTGIGLYMAKKVVMAHGGTILFESRDGEGSEFGFRIPVALKEHIKTPSR